MYLKSKYYTEYNISVPVGLGLYYRFDYSDSKDESMYRKVMIESLVHMI